MKRTLTKPYMSHRPLPPNVADVCRTAPAYGGPYMTRSMSQSPLPVRKQAGPGGHRMNDFYAYGNVFFLLLVSSLTDIWKRIIPIWVCIGSCIAALGLQLLYGLSWQHVAMSVLSGLLLAAIFLVNALFFEGGGGDCILAFSMGVYLGARAGLAIILISCLLLLVYCLITKRREACPLAPFLLTGTIFYLFLGEIL